MKNKKIIMLIMIVLIFMINTGCSKQDKTEEPYLKYIITTYSGGKTIDTFEVYSDMGWQFNKNFVVVWNNPNEEILLFRSTLDYKVEEMIK